MCCPASTAMRRFQRMPRRRSGAHFGPRQGDCLCLVGIWALPLGLEPQSLRTASLRDAWLSAQARRRRSRLATKDCRPANPPGLMPLAVVSPCLRTRAYFTAHCAIKKLNHKPVRNMSAAHSDSYRTDENIGSPHSRQEST